MSPVVSSIDTPPATVKPGFATETGYRPIAALLIPVRSTSKYFLPFSSPAVVLAPLTASAPLLENVNS